MTGPTIKVSADAGAVLSELRKINEAAEKVNESLSAGELEIDADKAQSMLSALEESAASLTKKLEDAVEAGGDLSGLDLDRAAQELDSASKAAEGLDKKLMAAGRSGGSMAQTVRHAKDTADHVNRAAKAQAAMAKDGQKLSLAEASAAKRKFDSWRDSGARGTSSIKGKQFDEWASGGWRDFSMDEREARRHRSDVLRSVGVGPAGGGGGGASQHADEKKAERVGRWSAAAGALGGMAGSMTSGGDGGMWGGAGSAVGSAIGGGAGMMFGGPIGAVVGALGSKLLGGIGASIDAGMERAGQESSDYTDLRQALGATETDFEDLRGSVRQATEGLGLAYNESAKMARAFGREAGKHSGDISKEVSSAAGFARGYGMAPEMANQFFAQMRHYGQTSNDRDSKRLAVQIGEAVQRGGTSTKMDEVLSSISGYVSTATKASLTDANAGAYASFMASMTGLKTPGLSGDPAAAASMMGAADSAMRQGGGFGEASKNFSLGLYQRKFGNGFNVLDMDFMNEQGAFGTASRAYGRDSEAYKFAQMRGDTAKMRQYDEYASKGGDTTVLAMQMQALEQQFGGSTDGFRKAIQSHFGVGAGQASAMFQAYKSDGGLGNLEKQLKQSGVDTGKLNTKQIMSLSELAVGDDSTLRKQADKLKGLTGSDALSKEERAKLSKAQESGDTEELRKVVLGMTALHDSTRDEGEKQRRVQADMNNAIQKLATELIPLTLRMKDGVVALVEHMAPDSDFATKAKKERADTAEAERSAKSDVETKSAAVDLLQKEFDAATPAQKPGAKKALDQAISWRDAAVDRARSQVTYNSSDEHRKWAEGLKKSDGTASAPIADRGAEMDAASKVRPVAGTAATANAKAIETGRNYSQGNIGGLDDAHTRALVASTAATESGGGKLDAMNSAGYIGRYQAGAGWLAEAGLINGGAAAVKAAMKADGHTSEYKWGLSGGMTRFLKNRENWAGGMSYEKYMGSADAQDAAFKANSDKSYQSLLRKGVITPKMSQDEIAGILKARHIAGEGGAASAARGEAGPADANGTTALKYKGDLAAGNPFTKEFSRERMPAGGLAESKKVGQQQVTVAGEMVVVDQNGKRTGQTVPIKQVGAPVAAGSAV